jgi:hypothetical protein
VPAPTDKLASPRGSPMKPLKWIGAALVAVAVALGLGPLSAEMLRNWMSNNGYLEHPEVGIAWLISTIASVTKFASFYWVLSIAIGAAIAWICYSAISAYLNRRTDNRQKLARKMILLAAGIKQRQGRNTRGWPDNVKDIRPRIDGCIIDAKKQGLSSLPQGVFERLDGVIFVHDYFHHVGTLISEGHWKEAKEHARKLRDDFKK